MFESSVEEIGLEEEGCHTVETEQERLDRDGIYGEIKRELIKCGIPAHEIAFIHDFKTPAEKARAFADANAGMIRVMIASTEKAGAGTNMQERLAALHHLDGPWRPSDVEQREGRILRCPFTDKLACSCRRLLLKLHCQRILPLRCRSRSSQQT